MDVLSLMVSEKNNPNICFKTGNNSKVRIISINKVKESLKAAYNFLVNKALESFTNTALVSLHVLAGCGRMNVVAGFGKLKPFKIMAKNVAYKKIFEKLGEHWHLHDNITEELESFVCNLYSHGSIKDSNLL